MAGPTTQSVTPPRSADLRERADRLFQSGDHVAADQAYLGYVAAATDDPELMQAGAALMANQLAVAERLLKDRLKRYPTDIAAIRMLAELATHQMPETTTQSRSVSYQCGALMKPGYQRVRLK